MPSQPHSRLILTRQAGQTCEEATDCPNRSDAFNGIASDGEQQFGRASFKFQLPPSSSRAAGSSSGLARSEGCPITAEIVLEVSSHDGQRRVVLPVAADVGILLSCPSSGSGHHRRTEAGGEMIAF